MQVRFPWILSRKRLISAALIDCILFSALYYALFKWRFDLWPGISFRLAVLLAVWLLCSYVFGRYVSVLSSVHLRPGFSFIKQISSTSLVFLLTLGICLFHLWLFNQDPVESTFRSFLIPFLGSLAFFSSAVQYLLLRVALRQNPGWSYTWFFVGSSIAYQQFQQKLQWTRLSVNLVDGLPLASDETFPRQIVVEDINLLQPVVLSHLLFLQQHGSTVLSRLSWCEAVLQRFPSDFLADADLIGGEFLMPAGTLQGRLKRIGDVTVSAFLLLVTSPLFLISALLIKFSDGGPVFYSQVRTGYGGRPYRIWKLRSMHINAERKGAQWSSLKDSRITKIGAILRRTRFDELPQLWCVLTGSMSLIGPRPERPEFDSKLEQLIPHYSLRHSIRPGLSGWAQVNYPYGASVEDSANKLSYDLYYLRNFSFWLDLLILFKTIRLVFNAQGALPVVLNKSN